MNTLSVSDTEFTPLVTALPNVVAAPAPALGSLGRLIQLLTKLGYSVGFILVALLGVLWWFQEQLLFHPKSPQGLETPDKNPKPFQNPGQMDMDYEDVTMTTPDNCKLHAWFIKQKLPLDYRVVPTLIFFQGNAGNMGLRLPNILGLYQSCSVNIFAVSYRGYGYSSGTPSEHGVYCDAETSLNYLLTRRDVDPEKIIVFGRSIGGAVAIDLASKRDSQIRAVITENTFTSLRDMAAIVFPFLKYLSSLVPIAQRVFMTSILKVPLIQAPMMYISGLQDALVPPAHVALLHNATTNSSLRRLYTVANGSHNGTWQEAGAEYYEIITKFINDALQLPFPRKTTSDICTKSS